MRAPAHLGFWGKAWWWIDFLILVKLARLRFIGLLLVIGLIIVKWDVITAYYERWSRPTEHAHVGSEFEYFCPMHPSVIRDNPKDKCSICFMPLSKRRKGDSAEEALPPGIVNRVQLTPYRVVLAGVKTWEVKYLPLTKEITTVGFVDFDERKMKHVAARVKGRIDSLFVNETGRMVREHEELASLYSPDLVTTVENLIIISRSGNYSLEESTRERLRLWGISDKQIDLVIGVQNMFDGMRTGDNKLHEQARQQLAKLNEGEKFSKALHNLLESQRTRNGDLQETARRQLVDLGMHADQVRDIIETGKAIRHLIIRSPISGHILKKYVKEGQYVDEGSPLYDIVDLSTVWIQAQVYEEDMPFLPMYHNPLKKAEAARVGLPVTATTRTHPGRVFAGKLAFVFPHVDQDTRTVLVRFELDNPDHILSPGATATVTLKIPPIKVAAFTKALDDDWRLQSAAVNALLPTSNAGGASALASLVDAAGRRATLQQGLLLAVPESAVIDTGKLQLVYREVMPGEYEGVKVNLGPRMVDGTGVTYYPILNGVNVGDKVVAAGSFLIDAETRLNPAAGSIYFGGSGSKGQGSVTVRPSTPEDEDAKIAANLARLSLSDRLLAGQQRFCPILKEMRLGSMGLPLKIVVNDRPVFLCCKSCEARARARPTETLAAIEQLKKAHSKGN